MALSSSQDMSVVRRFHLLPLPSKLPRLPLRLVLAGLLVLAVPSVAQNTPTATPQQTPAQSNGDEPVEGTKKITPQQAQELFASIDSTLEWLSRDTGFVIKKKVKGELASREQVEKYVESRLSDDQDAKRLQRSEIVLKKFGLLPREFDLNTFLVQLLKEQVAGYYDVKTKTMYLLDWLAPDVQKPVLAHELTHALQDQNFDLKKWEDPKAPKGTNKNEFSFDEDEASTARSAVAEGQGMVTLVDAMLKDSGRSVANAPQVVPLMRKAMESNGDFPLLQKAPLMIRESLVFPYGDGLSFEAALLQRGGKDLGFSGPFRHPPEDTHQVLDVEAYLESFTPHWVVIPDLKKETGSKYEKYDEGSIGQFDTKILIEQYASPEDADKLADSWKGGAYYAASSRDSHLNGTARIALLYLSRWSSDAAANQFARIYANYVPKRYEKAERVAADQAPKQLCASTTDCDEAFFYHTEEGWVSIQRVGSTSVMVTESFDPDVAKSVAEKVLTANPENTITTERHSLMAPLRTSAVIQDAIGRILAARLMKRFSRQNVPLAVSQSPQQ